MPSGVIRVSFSTFRENAPCACLAHSIALTRAILLHCRCQSVESTKAAVW